MINLLKSTPACVMGNVDLVAPLGLAGIKSVVAGDPESPVFYSRYVHKDLSWKQDKFCEGANLQFLVRFGMKQKKPTVLFYESDPDLLLVSQHREQLAKYFRFVIAEPTLVEELTDKERFQVLAQRLNLPVPFAFKVNASNVSPSDLDLDFPFIIKPTRHTNLRPDIIQGLGKALLIDNAEVLRKLLPRLAAANLDLLVQRAIPGPESRIESYHVYVDHRGATAAEFTGRKIRTYPISCGHSTALETTDVADVRALGREIVQKLNLRGVAKFDFKRGPDGTLHLLEINPRFNLWHHLGAVAGVNIPALVYADLMGLPRPARVTARAGVRWCNWVDMRAARACGIPIGRWILWAIQCDAKSAIAWDDPLPLLRGGLSKIRRWRSLRDVK